MFLLCNWQNIEVLAKGLPKWNLLLNTIFKLQYLPMKIWNIRNLIQIWRYRFKIIQTLFTLAFLDLHVDQYLIFSVSELMQLFLTKRSILYNFTIAILLLSFILLWWKNACVTLLLLYLSIYASKSFKISKKRVLKLFQIWRWYGCHIFWSNKT